MNLLKLQGNWNIAAGELKQGLGKLAGDFELFLHGQEQEIFGQLQKHASTNESARRALHEWAPHLNS